jgi:hypothetical protein
MDGGTMDRQHFASLGWDERLQVLKTVELATEYLKKCGGYTGQVQKTFCDIVVALIPELPEPEEDPDLDAILAEMEEELDATLKAERAAWDETVKMEYAITG